MSKTCQISPHIQTALQISNYWADYTFYHLSIVFIKSWDAFRDSSRHLAAAAAAADHGCCLVHSPRFPPLAGQIASAWRTWWPYQHEPPLREKAGFLPWKNFWSDTCVSQESITWGPWWYRACLELGSFWYPREWGPWRVDFALKSIDVLFLILGSPTFQNLRVIINSYRTLLNLYRN